MTSRVGTKILLVDDHDDLRDTLHALLLLSGYDARSAKNGREALEQLLDGDRPDVVIMDLAMPEMNGWQLRREMLERQSLAAIPVIVMTAAATWEDQMPQAVAHLRKPVDVEELYAVIDRVAGRRERDNGNLPH